MTNYADLPRKLIEIADFYVAGDCEGPHEQTIREAAAAIESLLAERDALRKDAER